MNAVGRAYHKELPFSVEVPCFPGNLPSPAGKVAPCGPEYPKTISSTANFFISRTQEMPDGHHIIELQSIDGKVPSTLWQSLSNALHRRSFIPFRVDLVDTGFLHETDPRFTVEIPGARVEMPPRPWAADTKRQQEAARARFPWTAEFNWPRVTLHRPPRPTCQTCDHFGPRLDALEGHGECRKSAPSLDGFPPMPATGWCGDHEIKTHD
jgi:hypothetical protein